MAAKKQVKPNKKNEFKIDSHIAIILILAAVLLFALSQTKSGESKASVKEFTIGYSGLEVKKKTETTENSQTETVAVSAKAKLPEIVLLTGIPKPLAEDASGVKISSNGKYEVISNSPLIISTIAKDPAMLSLKMEFEKPAKDACTVNFVLPKEFMDGLDAELKVQIYERVKESANLELNCENVNKLENNMAKEFIEIFKG